MFHKNRQGYSHTHIFKKYIMHVTCSKNFEPYCFHNKCPLLYQFLLYGLVDNGRYGVNYFRWGTDNTVNILCDQV